MSAFAHGAPQMRVLVVCAVSGVCDALAVFLQHAGYGVEKVFGVAAAIAHLDGQEAVIVELAPVTPQTASASVAGFILASRSRHPHMRILVVGEWDDEAHTNI